MLFMKILRLAVLAVAAVGVSAHAKRTSAEMTEYRRQVVRDTEALSKCLDTPELKELNARMIAQRRETLGHMRKARGINVRPRGTRC